MVISICVERLLGKYTIRSLQKQRWKIVTILELLIFLLHSCFFKINLQSKQNSTPDLSDQTSHLCRSGLFQQQEHKMLHTKSLWTLQSSPKSWEKLHNRKKYEYLTKGQHTTESDETDHIFCSITDQAWLEDATVTEKQVAYCRLTN